MLSKDQSHRILEDVQRLALACRLARKLAKTENQILSTQLVSEEADAIGRDMQGIINWNDNNNKGGK